MEAESDILLERKIFFLNYGQLVRNEEWEGRGGMQ